jgi:hypothetical protein
MDIVSDRCSNPASQFRITKEAPEAIAGPSNGSRLTSGSPLSFYIFVHITGCNLGQRHAVNSHPREQIRHDLPTVSDRGSGQSSLLLGIKELIEAQIKRIV